MGTPASFVTLWTPRVYIIHLHYNYGYMNIITQCSIQTDILQVIIKCVHTLYVQDYVM